LFNIDLVAQWIPTDENFVADALSRHDFKRLANYGYVVQASELHRPHPIIPTSITPEVASLLWNGIAPSIRRSYSSAVNLFETFSLRFQGQRLLALLCPTLMVLLMREAVVE
jgi:hypothetical protein